MNQVNPVKQLNQVKPANQVKQVKQVNKVNQVNQVKQVKRKKKEKKEREFLAGGRRDQSMVVQDVLADLKIISRRVVLGSFFPFIVCTQKSCMGYVLLIKALERLRLLLKQTSLLE